jgi:hypothetical protein
MLELLGLIVAWWIGWMIFGLSVNSLRVKSTPDGNIRDGFSSFLIGVAIGPMALLPPFDDKTLGGVVGTTAFILLYSSL